MLVLEGMDWYPEDGEIKFSIEIYKSNAAKPKEEAYMGTELSIQEFIHFNDVYTSFFAQFSFRLIYS